MSSTDDSEVTDQFLSDISLNSELDISFIEKNFTNRYVGKPEMTFLSSFFTTYTQCKRKKIGS